MHMHSARWSGGCHLQVDAVYMSPPWGGPSYSASTFEVDRDVGGLGCNMHQLLASAFSLLPEGTSHTLPQEHHETQHAQCQGACAHSATERSCRLQAVVFGGMQLTSAFPSTLYNPI